MKQLTINLKSGNINIMEVPLPALPKNSILVRNFYSLISAGTEEKRIVAAKKGYLGKAKEKPEQFKQVIENLKKEGFSDTYHKVMTKLDSLTSFGYSCAGEIIKVGDGVSKFSIGDLVACASGQHAVHAEVVSVPFNLCAKVPSQIDLKYAAFTTVGAIALQGIRQSGLKLGENCAIIGLGLIGQMTIQLLNSGGISSIGIDIDPWKVEKSKCTNTTTAIKRNDPQLFAKIESVTKGAGVDAVIITAGTSSLDPIELAGQICRKKGVVVVVGAVPTGFSRNNYYKKELTLKMSCSYGPGRYDVSYEEKGIDYPLPYVRWTENRNMQAFLNLLEKDKLNIQKLVSHICDFEKAQEAYNLILQKSEAYLGILLAYDVKKPIEPAFAPESRHYETADVSMGFVGAGSFAQKRVLPVVKKLGQLRGVVTAKGNNARNIADKYGFQYCAETSDDIVQDPNINTVFVMTRHDLHAETVIKCLKNDKNVFVEKPLCMNPEELDEIKNEYEKTNCHLMVGFNRRFAPLIKKIQDFFSADIPKAINYRINVGQIPKDHWTQDKDLGGGRIIGEACHFIDLVIFLVGSKPVSVYSNAMDDALNLMDTINISLNFEDGSIANISYFANGSNRLNKEYLEVYSGGITAALIDYKSLNIYGNKKNNFRDRNQDKGHRKEIEQFLSAVKNSLDTPIPFEEIYSSTLTTFKVIESIQKRKVIYL